ncbi:MAG TPA: hypothetical protein VLA51_02475 [Paracoccaceae bacterium]|nr:hypothetical protein [Paracoccaceae bacterium]
MLDMIRNLARDTLFRPRLAARALRDWTLSVATVTEAALLLACLSTLSKYLLLRYLTSLNFEEDVVISGPPIGDVIVQFGAIYVASVTIQVLGRMFNRNIPLIQSLKLYIWFNLVFFVMATALLGLAAVLPAVAAAMSIALVLWSIYAVGQFWAEMLGGNNPILGFVLVLTAMILASILTVLAADVIGIPMMELAQRV